MLQFTFEESLFSLVSLFLTSAVYFISYFIILDKSILPFFLTLNDITLHYIKIACTLV